MTHITTVTHGRGDAAHVPKDDMPSTFLEERQSPPRGVSGARRGLQQQFESIVGADDVRWSVRYRLIERLGSGSQGVVFLAERMGAHNICLPVALKIFSPQSHADPRSYRREMERLAQVTMQLALIQQDHLLDVHNFVKCRGVRMLVIARDERVLALIRGLIAPDPANRFPDAEAADFLDHGAANFQRELVKGDLSSEYENEIRLWLQEVE